MTIDDFNAQFAAHVDRIRRAFVRSLACATWPVVWSCEKGMHEPFFFEAVWICNACSKPLDGRARFA